MTTKTATVELIQDREHRDQVEQRIREVRDELGGKAQEPGHVWQELRDAWSMLVSYHRELFGPPVAIEGGGPVAMPPYWPGPLIA